jgi:hypothetical protein
LWWQGDLRGLEGLRQLETIIVPVFRAGDDLELAKALLALADLMRRHGGRDPEVRTTFADAYATAEGRGDWTVAGVVVDQWWAYLASLRDVDGLIDLMLRCRGVPQLGSPSLRVRAQMAACRSTEPIVAEQLGRRAMAALSAHNEPAAWDVLIPLVETLELAGRGDEAWALTEQAWIDGCTSAAVLDRLSSRLERDEDYTRAVEVCARGLRTPPAGTPAPILSVLKKRHRRCQERLARSARLFG